MQDVRLKSDNYDIFFEMLFFPNLFLIYERGNREKKKEGKNMLFSYFLLIILISACFGSIQSPSIIQKRHFSSPNVTHFLITTTLDSFLRN